MLGIALMRRLGKSVCIARAMSYAFCGLVGCFEFSMAGSHCTSGNIRIQARVIGDHEVVAIVGVVKFILHCEAKMFLLSIAVWAGDCLCIFVGLLLDFFHAGICRFAIIWGEL